MTPKRNMIILFMDGSKVVYDFPKQSEDENSFSSRLKKLLDMQYIVIEGDGAMHFYPVSNIKSIQVYPLPEKLPEFVIQGAELIDGY